MTSSRLQFHGENAVYIGDGCYASIDPLGRVWLETTDGYRITNAICLEPEVYIALIEYVNALKRGAR